MEGTVMDRVSRRELLRLLSVIVGMPEVAGAAFAASTNSPSTGGPTFFANLDELPGGYGSPIGQDRSLLLTSMQGILNRKAPTLWLKSNPGQTPGMGLWESIFEEVRT